ncbi:MAG: sigma-70 family RNA polymerase sigma factor, partial [Epulopiscium sp.]|nr:sigma-70 family RNA polymerase sigma factor [Candidatus Epulonipiscium sp.]
MERTQQLILEAQQGSMDAKETLISENSGLIWSIVRRFRGRGYDLEDLYQIGSIGLLKCVDKFDVSYEVKFSTYAVPMIMGEIKRFLRDDGMIKVSRPLKELAVKAKYLRESMMHETGKEVTIG